MAIEIERKFLVDKHAWEQSGKGESARICQAYLANDALKVVRIRIYGERAFITIKAHTAGMLRPEYEYEIPVTDADEMIQSLSDSKIEKVRYRVPFEGKIWEVDEFAGENDGLIIAELELDSVDESFDMPSWLGKEVTDDPRYYNASLVLKPYLTWTKAD